MIEMNECKPPERSRTYHFPDGSKVVLENVTHVLVRPSGSMRIKTGDGKFHIIPPVWNHIELDMDHWSF